MSKQSNQRYRKELEKGSAKQTNQNNASTGSNKVTGQNKQANNDYKN